MTIEKLAGITQQGFIDVEMRLSERINKLDTRIDKLDTRIDKLDTKVDNMQVGLVQLVESVLTVVQNIEGRVNEMHTAIRIDMPDLRDRVEILEGDMEKVKEKVKIPA